MLRGLFRRWGVVVATLVVGASAGMLWPLAGPEACRGEAAFARFFRPECARPNLVGVAVGLLLGVVVATGLEYRDSTFRRKDDLARVLSLPVLAVVPEIKTSYGRKPRGRRAVVIAIASIILAALAVAVAWWRLQL